MNSTKKYNEAINNSKNKLNNKISWVFKLESNAIGVKRTLNGLQNI